MIASCPSEKAARRRLLVAGVPTFGLLVAFALVDFVDFVQRPLGSVPIHHCMGANHAQPK